MRRWLCILLACLLCVTACGFTGYAQMPLLLETRLVESSDSTYGEIDYHFEDENGNLIENSNHSAVVNAVLPESYDLRQTDYLPAVRDQGDSGACWSFAAIGSITSNALKQGLIQDPVFSEAHLVWFAHNSTIFDDDGNALSEGTTMDNPYVYGGNWLYATSTIARGSGPAWEKDFPFHPYELSAMGHYAENDRFHSTLRLKEVLRFESSDFDGIKAQLMETGAMAMSYFHDDENYYRSAYYQNETTNINHAVLLVGWDDNYSRNNFKSSNRPSKDGAWLCQNSWSSDWGTDGYFWISYEDTSNNHFVSYQVMPKTAYDTIYQYDNVIYRSTLSYGSKPTITGANIFNANGNEALTAVSFYSTQATNYTVRIYRNLSRTAKPANGTLALTFKGVATEGGYHLAQLPERLRLNEGERFSVCVTLENGIYFPVEGNYAGYSGNVGESYLCSGAPSTSVSWTDTVNAGYNNICLKAMTLSDSAIIQLPSSLEAKADGVVIPTAGYTAKALLDDLALTGETVTVYAANGTPLTDDAPLTTDCYLQKSDRDGILWDEQKIAVLGDLDCDGIADGCDSVVLSCYVAGMITDEQLSAAMLTAADFNQDNTIDPIDLYQLRRNGLFLS